MNTTANGANKMRINVTLVIDIDPDTYRVEYSESSANQRDIRDYVECAAQAAVTDALQTIEARVYVKER